MPSPHETTTNFTEEEIIATYEREFTLSTAERDAELARVTLENALYEEFGEIRGGTEVILGDQ